MKSLTAKLALAALTLSLVGCGSLARLGTDAAVVVSSPVTIPLSAFYDSLDWGEHTDSAITVAALPANVPLHFVKHTAYTFVHLGDMIFSPFYLLASITPQNDLEPLSLYSLSEGYPWKSAPWSAFEE